MPQKIVSLVVAALMTSAVLAGPVEARKPRKSERVETFTYQTPMPAFTPVHPAGFAICNHGGAPGDSRGCKILPVGPNERYITIEIADATGLPAPAFWSQGEGGLGEEWHFFCGKTPEAARIKPAVRLNVMVYAYTPANMPPCAGTATQGTVTVAFSNHP